MNDEGRIIRPDPAERDPEEQRLAELYAESRVPLDRLPYTHEFEALFRKFRKEFPRPDSDESRRDLLHWLLKLRKAGKLPRHRSAARPDAGAKPSF